MNSPKRQYWIDSCKGFAIILVVIGHMEKGIVTAGLFPELHGFLETIDRLIYSFHMPLFWMLAGYTFYIAYCQNQATRVVAFKKQLINSTYVYFLFSFIQWIIQYVFSSHINTQVKISDLLLTPIRPMSPYWFTFVLVFYYIFFYIFVKIKISNFVSLLIIAALSSLGNPLDFDIVIPIRILLLHMLFFYLGIYFAKIKRMIADSNISFAVLSFIAIATMVLYTTAHPPYIPFVTDVLIPSIIGLFFFNLFYKASFIGKSKLFIFIGSYSLEIYVTHCILTAGTRVILHKTGVTNCAIMLILGTLLSIFLPIVWAYLMKKWNLHKFFFKPTDLLQKRQTTNIS